MFSSSFVRELLTHKKDGALNFIQPIVVQNGVNCIDLPLIACIEKSKSHIEKIMNQAFLNEIVRGMSRAFGTWYGIQIALLHPTVREVFKKPNRIKNNEYRKANEIERKNIVKYIKVHYLDPAEIEEVLYDKSVNKQKIKRKALVWYVIGHWRTRADGKKIFVRPYWKGALREIKRALPEREREVVIHQSK